MSLVTAPTAQSATGKVKEIYDEVQSMLGFLPNGLSLWGMNERALESQWNHIKEIMSLDQESQKLHAIIRYLMSEVNGCEYCIGFNGGMLINMFGMTQEKLTAVSKDPTTAPLNDKNKALLLFALKSVKNPHAVNQEDIKALKELGVSEKEMFDIVHAASVMFVVNTLFDTFKIVKD